MLLAGRLDIPDSTAALLFDLDGVLIDSLSLDYEIVHRLLEQELGRPVEVPRRVIRKNFPHAIPDFWINISQSCGLALSPQTIARLARRHEQKRATAHFPTHEGIPQIVDAARHHGLGIGVVSNNPTAEVRQLLATTGLSADVVVGNDEPGLRKKPAPDTYLAAATWLKVPPRSCVAIEDSIVGAQAASTAGCHTIGVATGANSFAELSGSPYTACCYTSFAPCFVSLGREGVTSKTLVSPNEFVSHMVEHLAWRLGCSIRLSWTNDDWHLLGVALGRQVRHLPLYQAVASTIGMIDDGSAEIHIRASELGEVALTSSDQVDLEWFLNSRAEQLPNGFPLLRLLEGLASGGELSIQIKVASFEDPHHTWEGVFRGVGIALDQMFNDYSTTVSPSANELPDEATGSAPPPSREVYERPVQRGWAVQDASPWSARVQRRTAESIVAVRVRLGPPSVRCTIRVADCVDVAGMAELLTEFAKGAGLKLDVNYQATRLSSSHVVTEDIGMALGRALRHVAIERMDRFGIQGAGASIKDAGADSSLPVRVGVSMEGRKFWKYVPMSQDYGEFRKSFLVGHTLENGMFTEDLDDFVDGLAGGLESSIIVHVDDGVDPVQGWPLLFHELGVALAGLLAVNPHRRSLTPGVKATLA
jgi:HAD superfamily hydrolase (TIGR01509 family)